jgi:DNA polymerase-3 subunit gamma/tau
MGQALYRKYRSKSLSEIIGQEHITETLSTALKTGRISHAYLFTGPRGVGKTSIARILAHEINGLPYTDDSTHMDIIEIDAASNRRIDEIRELRDKVYIAPTSSKYKVYIIDEVHMLTKEAFNALLKTLEEPPAHVVFILATTDAHKLPETIVSRTQRYNFKPVEASKVAAHLRSIADTEKITIDDAALTLLAEHGEGSFRDSISMLDQASSHSDSLTATDIQQLLGIPSAEAIQTLLDTIAASQSTAEVMTQLVALYDQGYQAAAIAKQLAALLRGQMIASQLSLPYDTALGLLTRLIEVPIAYDSARFLEISLLQIVSNGLPANVIPPAPVTTAAPDPVKASPKPEPAPEASKIESKKAALVEIEEVTEKNTKEAQEPESEPETTPIEIEKTEGKTTKSKPTPASDDDQANWQAILTSLKAKHNTLYGVVRMAEPDFSKAGTLTLTFAFEFHRKRLSDTQNQQKLQTVIHEVTGKNVRIECLVDKNVSVQPTKTVVHAPAKATNDSLANISNIFGGGELVE